MSLEKEAEVLGGGQKKRRTMWNHSGYCNHIPDPAYPFYHAPCRYKSLGLVTSCCCGSVLWFCRLAPPGGSACCWNSRDGSCSASSCAVRSGLSDWWFLLEEATPVLLANWSVRNIDWTGTLVSLVKPEMLVNGQVCCQTSRCVSAKPTCFLSCDQRDHLTVSAPCSPQQC